MFLIGKIRKIGKILFKQNWNFVYYIWNFDNDCFQFSKKKLIDILINSYSMYLQCVSQQIKVLFTHNNPVGEVFPIWSWGQFWKKKTSFEFTQQFFGRNLLNDIFFTFTSKLSWLWGQRVKILTEELRPFVIWLIVYLISCDGTWVCTCMFRFSIVMQQLGLFL